MSTCLTLEEERSYLNLLEEYQDVFVWSYKEMPGLDPKVASFSYEEKCLTYQASSETISSRPNFAN